MRFLVYDMLFAAPSKNSQFHLPNDDHFESSEFSEGLTATKYPYLYISVSTTIIDNLQKSSVRFFIKVFE